jgi:hypothetical protein
MRETITFDVKGIGEFEIIAEPTFLEKRRIESTLAGLYGGIVPLERARQDILKIYQRLKPGENGEIKIQSINDSYDIALVSGCNNLMKKCETYATIKVLGTRKPKVLSEITEEELKEIQAAHEVAVSQFFRNVKKRKTTTTNK